MRFAFFVVFLLFFNSCQTVTISPKGKKFVVSSTPDYERSQHFFLYGIIGQRIVNTAQICRGRAVRQMQTQQTFLDSLLASVTSGIYTPRTARVWCEN